MKKSNDNLESLENAEKEKLKEKKLVKKIKSC